MPSIVDEFHALHDISWYGSAYLMTSAAMQLPWGKAYTILPIHKCFLAGILIFEIGSIICAVAPSSTVLIIGRAIAGCGAAGSEAGSVKYVLLLLIFSDMDLCFERLTKYTVSLPISSLCTNDQYSMAALMCYWAAYQYSVRPLAAFSQQSYLGVGASVSIPSSDCHA